MYKRCKLVPFPVSEVSERKTVSKKNPIKKASSPSPRTNPFAQVKSLEKLPRLRPISPTFKKLPQLSHRLPIPSTAPANSVSLRIITKPIRLSSPQVRPMGTPTFLNPD